MTALKFGYRKNNPTGKKEFEFEILALPKMPNQLLGAHWRTRSGHAKKWKRLVSLACLPFKRTKPINRAELFLTRMSSHQSDYDGLSGSFKSVIDALVHCGVLADDTPDVIGHPVYRWEKAPPGKGKIKVRIVEIDQPKKES